LGAGEAVPNLAQPRRKDHNRDENGERAHGLQPPAPQRPRLKFAGEVGCRERVGPDLDCGLDPPIVTATIRRLLK
jgi:hypothetical protein